MIPILYKANEKSFTTNGVGRLSDAISCIVIEERNGVYELEMEYPIDGIHFSDIEEEMLIYAKPFDGGTNQIFRIYKIEKPINGKTTIYAEHISYLLNHEVVMPFKAGSCTEAFVQIKTKAASAIPFTFWTDKSVTANMNVEQPIEIRSLLGGTSGSILDVYGTGDYEFDNFTVRFHTNRGADNGVTLRYAKNITDLTGTMDIQGVYTGIVPYWKGADDNLVTLSESVVWSGHQNNYAYTLSKVVDFSSEWDNAPTQAQLRARAQTYLSSNGGWNPNQNIKVSFIALWQTEEYKDIAVLERVKMCDTVTVVYDKLGVNVKMRVISTEYNVLLERYNSIELGDAKTNLVKAVADTTDDLAYLDAEKTSELKKAIKHATDLINGGLGGHLVINTDADGHPNELLIMDTDSTKTAVNVWRFNLGGLGHSHSGYNGPFDDIALTMDGQINASRILTGYMSANRVRSGVLQSQNNNLIFNLDTGKLTVKGDLTIDSPNFKLTSSGATITGAINATSGTFGAANASKKITIGTNTSNASIYYGMTTLGSTANGFYLGTDGIALGGGKFKVTAAGALVASGADISGKVTATSGKIGDFTIDSKLYNGKSSFGASGQSGIYIGADGIALGKIVRGGDNAGGLQGFRVDKEGIVQVAGIYFFTGSGTNTSDHGLWYKGDDHIGSGGFCDFGSDARPSGSEPYNVLRSGTYIYGLEVKGECKATTFTTADGSWSVSDRRFKREIADIDAEKALSFVMSLKPKTFRLMHDDGTVSPTRHGFIAQDVQDAVRESDGGDWDIVTVAGDSVSKKSDGRLLLNYTEILADLVATVQRQQVTIDQLMQRIA